MTAKDAREAISKSRRERLTASRCNAGMTHQQALDVLGAAVKDLADDVVLRELLARNVEREVGRAS